VLEHLQAGRTSKEIARALAISPRTAEAHRRNLLRKLGIGSVKELMLRMVTRDGGSSDPQNSFVTLLC
jgi:DNA-binding CsgD family transcriptional regulator